MVKEPVSAPNIGRTVDGPKSYSNIGQTSTTTSKSIITKVEKPKEMRRKSNNERVRNYFGIRGGYNLSTFQDLKQTLEESSPGSTAKVADLAGYMGGILFNIGVSKTFSIQPEVLFSQQGA